MELPFVSVISPVLNGERHIRQCIEGLMNVDYPKGRYEIIFVDNGSSDGTVEIIKEYETVKLLVKENVKVGAVRNYGARHARGEILAFIDSDCIADRKWLQNAIHCLVDRQHGIVGSHYKVPNGCSLIGRAWAARSAYKRQEGEITYIPAGNLFISKELFDSVGGFDGSLLSSEDVDLCQRIRDKGGSVFSNLAIAVYHLGDNITLRQFFRREIWRGKEVLRHYLKYRKKSYLKATLIALYYLILIPTLVPIIFIALARNASNPLISIGMTLIVLPPMVFSFLELRSHRKYQYFFIIMFLHLVFGVARAIAILYSKREQ